MLGEKGREKWGETAPRMPRSGSVRQYCSLVIVSAAVISVIILTFGICGPWPSVDGPSFISVHSARQDFRSQGRLQDLRSPEDAGRSKTESDLYYVFPGDPVSAAVMYDHIQRRFPCSSHCLVSEHQVSSLTSAAKLVVVLGDPVLRLYREQCQGPRTCRPQELHAFVTRALQQAQDCISDVSAQLCVAARSQEPEGPIYRGIYSVFVEDWLLRLSRARIYVIRLEDLAANATKELMTALTQLDFIGDKVLSSSSSSSSQTVSQARLQAVPETEPNSSDRLLPKDILPQTRTALRDFYRPFNKLLSLILKDARFEWTDVPHRLR